ncbi:MAG: hypothetical protein LC113_13035 [Acidobacteria bacterium]|nr:hypothetical protein [Acidobacteriota bacterium]
MTKRELSFSRIAAIWAVGVLLWLYFALPPVAELSARWFWDRVSDPLVLLSLLLVTVALILLAGSRFVIVWLGVLVGLSILGAGVKPPQGFILYPGHLSLTSSAATLALVILFHGIEKAYASYIGAEDEPRDFGETGNGLDNIVELELGTARADTDRTG